MSRQKMLNIVSSVADAAVEDHVTSEDHGTTFRNNNLIEERGEDNAYEKNRLLRVQENKKRLEDLGVKNIANSLTSLAESCNIKKKTEKRKAHAGDVSDKDYQQPGRSVVSKKKPTRYISPMSIDRVANLTKLRRVIASNPSEKVALTTNATKHTMSEGNKERATRKMVLVDEAEYDHDEIFYGNGTDIEANGVHENVQEQSQDVGIEKATTPDMNTTSNLTTGAPKKVRGPTRKPEIWRMKSTDRILVTFNKHGKPVGDEGKELVQYLGTLVRMHEHVSIEYGDWRKVPMQQKEDLYTLVKSKFSFQPDETDEVKKWILHNLGKKWRTWKGLLKSRGFDPSLTVDEIVAQQTDKDNRVNETQFKELVSRWFTPKFQSTCSSKRSSRSKMKEPHVTGSKSLLDLLTKWRWRMTVFTQLEENTI